MGLEKLVECTNGHKCKLETRKDLEGKCSSKTCKGRGTYYKCKTCKFLLHEECAYISVPFSNGDFDISEGN